jgi:hypothetical protein
MRMPRVQFTMRRLMIGVAIAGLVSWLIRVALEVAGDPNGDAIFCVYQSPVTGKVSYLTECNPPTFWPRYIRRLMGWPWPGDFRCPCGDSPHVYTSRGDRLMRTFDRAEDADAYGAWLEAGPLPGVKPHL